MGNYRFKLSDMMPNAWFYKLKDNMGGRTTRNQTSSTTRKKKQPSSQQNSTTTTQSSKPKCNPRKSYYFTRELNHTSTANNNLNISETNFQQQPRKSSKQKPKKKKTPKTSFSYSSPVYSSEEESEFPDPEIRTDRVLLQTVKFDEKISTCSGCNKLQNDNNNDIIINVDNNSLAKNNDVFDSFPKLMMLPPIVTKPEKFNDFLNDDAKKKEIKKGSLKVKIVNSEQRKTNNNSRRFSVNSPGVKLKINSPRIGSRKVQLQLQGRKSVTGTGTGGYRRSISDSLAIVKSSVNPERDFRESMVEMIVQNNIRSSKDLEDLLACYLSLNSDEYHEIIIKVFKQIWFDLTDNQ